MSILDKQIPSSFAMFTAAGNRRLRHLSEQLLQKLHEVHAKDYGDDFYVEGKGPRTGEKKAYAWYFKAYRQMSQYKSYAEASDTAVRECVWSFAEECSQYAQYVPYDELDEVWYS